MNVKKYSPIQYGILILALATGLTHLILLNVRMMNAGDSISLPFTLNGLGFLAFIVGYFFPLPIFQKQHRLMRWAFIGYSVITIVAWVVMNGDKGPVGILTKLIELGLIVLLWMDKK